MAGRNQRNDVRATSWVLRCACLMAGCFALLELGIALMEAQKAIGATTRAAEEVRAAAAGWRAYSDVQVAVLTSPKAQKAIEAGIEAAAVWNGTGRLFNKQVIPRIMDTLDSLNIASLSLDKLVRDTSNSLNKQVLPSAESTLISANDLIQTAAEEIKKNSEATLDVLEGARKVVEAPELLGSLAEMESSLTHIDMVAKHLEEASKELPSIARSVEEIAQTSSRWRGWILMSQVASAISRAIF